MDVRHLKNIFSVGSFKHDLNKIRYKFSSNIMKQHEMYVFFRM